MRRKIAEARRGVAFEGATLLRCVEECRDTGDSLPTFIWAVFGAYWQPSVLAARGSTREVSKATQPSSATRAQVGTSIS